MPYNAPVDTTQLVQVSRARQLSRSGAARSIRIAAGLSMSEVARAVGVEPSTILRWEAGERTPRGEAAARYAALLEELMTR